MLPALALPPTWLGSRGTLHLSERRQRQVVALAAGAYLGLVVTLFVPAQRGHPSSPRTTWIVAGVLVGAPALVAILLALRQDAAPDVVIARSPERVSG